MNWLIDSPIIEFLEEITPSTMDELDEQYVLTMQQFIEQAHTENETHLQSIGTYRYDLFLAKEYAFMKLRTYIDTGLDPDTDDGQSYMLQNYWQGFLDTAQTILPTLSRIVVQDVKTWQTQMQGLV